MATQPELSEKMEAAHMRRALSAAQRGAGRVAPNPLVGAVLANGEHCVAEGAHERYGAAHAEVNAFANLPSDYPREKLTLYVTLEPCCHFGKTPPCTQRILKEGIKRVVVGCLDPFAEVSGKGVAQLRQAGLEVKVGVLEEECRWHNRRFITFHEQRRPYIILKWAQTSDGYLAPAPSTQALAKTPRLQISGPEAQRYVHEMRKQEAAILVGYRTALLDDPQLTVRLVENPAQLQPRRLVLDPKAELAARAPSLKLFSPELQSVFLATSLPTQAEYAKHYQLLKPGVSQVQAVCAFAYEQRLLSLIVEGGVRTLAQFISADCWDEIHRFSAATCLGAGQAGILAPSLNIRSLSTPSLPASLGLPAPITAQAKYQLGADLLEIFVRAGQIPNLVTELAAYPEHLHSVLTQD